MKTYATRLNATRAVHKALATAMDNLPLEGTDYMVRPALEWSDQAGDYVLTGRHVAIVLLRDGDPEAHTKVLFAHAGFRVEDAANALYWTNYALRVLAADR